MDIRKPNKSFRYNYTGVIRQLRYWARSETLYYGIPALKPPANPAEFTNVRVLAKQDDIEYILDVAINMSSLYVVGYCRWDNGYASAFFLDDHYDRAGEEVFVSANEKHRLRFSSTYASLEHTANLYRVEIDPSMTRVSQYLVNFYLEDPRQVSYRETQARLVLYLTQVLSEATRFSYIKKLYTDDATHWETNYKVTSLENNWQVISNAVKTSVRKTISPPMILRNHDGSERIVSNVDQIQSDLGILL